MGLKHVENNETGSIEKHKTDQINRACKGL